MCKKVDEKFFLLMGIDYKRYKERIRGIKSICGIDTEVKLSRQTIDKIIEYSFTGYKPAKYPQGLSDNIVRVDDKNEASKQNCVIQDVDKYIKDTLFFEFININNYQNDLDLACFMLTGSYLSKWHYAYIDNNRLPFSILSNDKGKTIISAWCKAYQDTFANNRTNIFELNEKPDKHDRIEKYSYRKVHKFQEDLNNSIQKINEELFKLENSKKCLDNVEEKRKKVLQCKSETSVENYILMNITLGLSLTQTVYRYLKDKEEKKLQGITQIIKLLVELKCYMFRDKIAEKILLYIEQQEYAENVINSMCKFLEVFVPQINKAYISLLHIDWRDCIVALKKNEESIWDEIRHNPIEICDYQDNEVLDDMKDEINIIDVIDKDSFDMDLFMKNLFNSKIFFIGNDRENREMQIRMSNEMKWKQREEIRRSKKLDSRYLMYAKIHEIVVVQSFHQINK